MEELGKLLKAERLKKNLTLQEVALVLKISAKVLQAIEDNNVSLLPPKAYIRGFVKSYSDYLRLDTKQLLETHFSIATTKTEGHSANLNLVKDPQENKQIVDQVNKSKPIWGSIILTLGLIGLIAICLKILNKYQKEAQTNAVATGATVESNIENLQNKNEVDSITNTEKKDATPSFEETNSLNNKKDEKQPEKTNTSLVDSQTTTTKTIEVNNVNPNSTVEKPNVKTNTVNTKNSELLIEATEDISVTLTTLEGKSETVLIQKDESKAFKVVGQIMLKTNNAGATFISVNGVDKGSLGNIGAMKEIKVP